MNKYLCGARRVLYALGVLTASVHGGNAGSNPAPNIGGSSAG